MYKKQMFDCGYYDTKMLLDNADLEYDLEEEYEYHQNIYKNEIMNFINCLYPEVFDYSTNHLTTFVFNLKRSFNRGFMEPTFHIELIKESILHICKMIELNKNATHDIDELLNTKLNRRNYDYEDDYGTPKQLFKFIYEILDEAFNDKKRKYSQIYQLKKNCMPTIQDHLKNPNKRLKNPNKRLKNVCLITDDEEDLDEEET